MKNIIYIALSFIIFLGCSKNDENSNELIGNWVLIEIFNSDGGSSASWYEVNEEDSYFINLKEDFTFSSNKFIDCSTGVYIFDELSFSMIYDCEDFTTDIENPPGTFKENYYFENNKLIITPDYLNCDEGCLYKFKKVPLGE